MGMGGEGGVLYEGVCRRSHGGEVEEGYWGRGGVVLREGKGGGWSRIKY